MKLQVNNQTRVRDVQAQFRQHFPFLKIEFFNFHKAWEPDSKDGFNYNPLFRICCIPGVKRVVKEWHLDRRTTAGKVEEMLYRDLGLIAQVYRKYQGAWILTNGSDQNSLEELNQLGSGYAKRYSDSWNVQSVR